MLIFLSVSLKGFDLSVSLQGADLSVHCKVLICLSVSLMGDLFAFQFVYLSVVE